MCLKDKDIRVALRAMLDFQYATDSETLILDELGLRHGAARVDVAVINGILHGYEIKSDMDTLSRLPHQIRVYNSVLDKVSIVVGRRYLEEIRETVPEWWGITFAEIDEGEKVIFSTLRFPQLNPQRDLLAMTKLLWRDEALSLLEELNSADGFRYKPRKVVYTHLARTADPIWLHARVCSQLRARTNWRADSQQM